MPTVRVEKAKYSLLQKVEAVVNVLASLNSNPSSDVQAVLSPTQLNKK